MADAHFKPDDAQREELLAALSRAYTDPHDMRQALKGDFPQIVDNVHFEAAIANVAYQVLERVDADSVHWAQFLRVVRRGNPDAARLSAIVDRILLSGALARLDGTLKQVAGLNGAESTAFKECLPPFTEQPAWRPP